MRQPLLTETLQPTFPSCGNRRKFCRNPRAQRAQPPLFQPDTVDIVPLRHVRQDHFVADLQARKHFDGGNRAASQLHVDSRGFRAVGRHLEQADGAVGLAMHWSSHVHHVLRFSNSMVPSTLRSARALGGNGSSKATSTVTVPFTTEGSCRETWPVTTPLR